MFDTESGDPSGTLLVLEAESLEAVREILQNDPYWAGDVVRVVVSSMSAQLTVCSGIKKKSRSKQSHLPLLALSMQRPEWVLSAVL